MYDTAYTAYNQKDRNYIGGGAPDTRTHLLLLKPHINKAAGEHFICNNKGTRLWYLSKLLLTHSQA